MYQALYRAYRPRTFSEVVGQQQVTETLKNEIARGRVGHAYLFTGSRGTGKTTCSKILAKAVNCPNQKDGEPCGVCDICRGIDDGSVLDVTEIDAASNNGVDNIRQLREEASFTPAQTKYRVYIIDETHMLSTGAFNALLKIMEEPPEHVIFILATTEVHKIPATILSRCQRFDFRRIRPEVIEGRLQEVCAREGIQLEPDAARRIARLSEGGMRDALSLLDVCRSYGETVTVQVVDQAAGLAMQDSLFAMGQAVLEHNIPAVLDTIDQLHEASVDFEKMTTQLIGHYRGLMMARALKEPERFVLGMEEDLDRLRQQAAQYSMEQILTCLTVLQDALSRMSRTAQTRVELEMALIRLCTPQTAAAPSAPAASGAAPSGPAWEGVLARLEAVERELSRLKAAPPSAPAQAQTQPKAEAEPSAKEEPKPAAAAFVEAPQVELTQVEPFGPWAQVLEELRRTNKALSGALVDAGAYLHRDIVLIDCQDPFFLELIRNNDFAKKSIHDALIQAAGRDYRIGPLRRDKYRPADAAAPDPLEQMIQSASQQGVEVQVEE